MYYAGKDSPFLFAKISPFYYTSHKDLKNRNLSILIEIDSNSLSLIDIDANEVVRKYVVATGKRETPTPIKDL